MMPRVRWSVRQRWRHRSRVGAQLVEFAICLPLLLLVFLGSIEMCRLNMLRHGAAQAAYEGARQGIVPGATADDVRTAAAQILDSIFVVGYTVTVTPAVIERTTPQVTVDITVPIAANSWITPRFCTSSTMTRSFTLQREIDETVSVP
jgi:Flp pilus assembly protein TadG